MPRESTAEKAFRWRDGYRSKIDADAAGAALVELAAGKDVESLTAAEVVEAARPARAPLHAAFEWDDAEAAGQHRLWQARMMLNNITIDVTYEDETPTPVRVFANLRDGAGYRRSVEVERDEDMKGRLISLALADIRSARARLAEVRGMSDVVDDLAAVERKILREL